MIVKGNATVGLKIVTVDTGTVVETVDDIAYNPETHYVEALLVSSGGLFSSAKAVRMKDVRNIGEDAVIVPSADVIQSVKELGDSVRSISDSNKHLVKTNVLTVDGKELGKVTDIYFDSTTGKVDRMEVSQGGLKTLSEGKKSIKPADIVTIGADATIVSTYIEAKLEAQGEKGGLKGKLNEARDKAEELAEDAKEATQDAMERAKDASEDASRKVKAKSEELAETAREKADEARDELDERMDDAKAKASELHRDVEHKADELEDTARAKAKDVKRAAEDVSEDVQRQTERAKRDADPKLEELKRNAKDVAEDAKDSVNEGVRNAKEHAENIKDSHDRKSSANRDSSGKMATARAKTSKSDTGVIVEAKVKTKK